MAADNFKPTLWEGALLANFHSVSIADVLATKPTEIKGNKVIFNRVAGGTLKDYSGSVDWDDIDTTPVEMVFDKKKYFAFALDDVDKVQLKADLLSATTKEHAAVLAETYDKDFFAALLAGTKLLIGSSSAKKKVTAASAYDYIVDLGTMLSKKKVPKVNRFVTVNADYLGLLSKDKRFTANPKVLENGVVEGQTINGMQVMCSEELPANVIMKSKVLRKFALMKNCLLKFRKIGNGSDYQIWYISSVVMRIKVKLLSRHLNIKCYV